MNVLGQSCSVVLFIILVAGVMCSQVSSVHQANDQQPSAEQPVKPTVDESSQTASTHPEDQMQVPPPVAVESYPMTFSSEGRSNYLRYGVSFSAGYMDHVQGYGVVVAGSDETYSVAPVISIDTKTPRLELIATYAPGFTFYQHTSALNESDHNASLKFKYRLSPHVTFTAEDAFVKSSNIFNQQNLGPALAVTGGPETTNLSVIAPVADHLSNTGMAGIDYQYSLNGMIGASGSFTYLDYPNPSQVTGLYNSRSVAGSAFYSHRISKMHYVGATYQHQLLLAYPVEGQSKTQTDAVFLFYTLYPTSHVSVSMFSGPQYSDTYSPVLLGGRPSQNLSSWNAAGGASLDWQGKLTSFALSYSHSITPGWGLSSAVLTDSGSTAVRRQLWNSLSGAVAAGYARTQELNQSTPGSNNGHSLFGTASLSKPIGQHLNVQLGYSRLHQSYSQVTALAATPNTNRVFVALSYQFLRPLGR